MDFRSSSRPLGATMIIHDDNVTYEQWCKNLGRDPRDDENYNAYCEWKNSQ
jgi:hypothetical protein